MRRILPYSLLLALIFQAHAYQLPDQKLYHYQCKNCFNLSRNMLSTSWFIEDKTMVPAEIKPVKSKRYYRKITGEDLKKGIELGIMADGAVIRVTPVQPKQLQPMWRDKFAIKTARQKKPLADMVQSLTDEQDFKQQFAVGPALIFQLKPGLLKQQPHLVYDDEELDNNSQWQLSVYDKMSDLYLSVSLDKNRYHLGDSVKAVIEINEPFGFPTVNWVEARVMSPTGDGMAVDLKDGGMFTYHGELPIQTKQVARGENWYFMVMADLTVNGSHTLRTAQATFSYVVPSAKVRTIYRPSSAQPLSFKANVEAVQSSRYQLQAVLFATGDDGDIHAVSLAQTSAWLDPGVTELPLQFKKSLPSNMHSPYYLGQIELVDDAQLKPVYRYNEQIVLTKLDA